MRACQPPKKVTQHTSGCKRPHVDYTQYDTSTDQLSPPKRRRKVDLKKKPSRIHMAAEKYKTKPLGGPRPVRNKNTCSPPPPLLMTTKPVTMTEGDEPSTSGIVTVAATAEETQTAIDALLALGSDLPVPDIELDENAALVPLAPQAQEAKNPMQPTDETQPLIIGTAVKIEEKEIQPKIKQSNEKKKKTFVTVEYKLKWKYINTTHKFPCNKCREIFGSQREVNEHFRTTHPPVQ